jgi:hypothetical protein
MARDAHVQAVGFAGLAVEELEGQIEALRQRVDEVKAIGINAVGEVPSTDSGRQALTAIDLIKVALSEATEQCEAAKQRFNDYGRGI